MLQKDHALKNSAPFRSCISQIINILIDNAEDPHIVMSMYHLLEYRDNYYKNCGIVIVMKLIIMMMMLQMVNHLSIRQK